MRRDPRCARSRAAHRAAARRTAAGSDRSARSAGRARRPFASQASRIQERGSPPRQRTRSTCHRARPRPGAGRARTGRAQSRQRVTAAVGRAARSFSATVHQRRSTKRGDARRLGGELQPARGGEAEARDLADDGGQAPLAQAFLDERQNFAVAPGLGIDDPVRVQAGAAARPGAKRSRRVRHQRTGPLRRAAIPAVKRVAAPANSAAGPASTISCSAPRARPPPGR